MRFRLENFLVEFMLLKSIMMIIGVEEIWSYCLGIQLFTFTDVISYQQRCL